MNEGLSYLDTWIITSVIGAFVFMLTAVWAAEAARRWSDRRTMRPYFHRRSHRAHRYKRQVRSSVL